MLSRDDTVLIVIDLQGRLARIVQDSGHVIAAAAGAIRGAEVLGVPILWTEQLPDKIGGTVEEIVSLLAGTREPIPKSAFSCCREPRFADALEALGRRQVLLAGIETHICVWQTAADLLERAYDVQVLADAVSSRTPENRQIGLDRMRHAGASITSVETALFELLGVAEGDAFKAILKIVK